MLSVIAVYMIDAILVSFKLFCVLILHGQIVQRSPKNRTVIYGPLEAKFIEYCLINMYLSRKVKGNFLFST